LSGAEVPKLFRVKVFTIVRDDAVRNSVSEYNLLHELDGHARVQILDRFGFNPLGELVDCYEQMCETTLACSERSNHVQTPHSEWPDEWNSLQSRRRLV
jgi:hypothetical protein